MDREITDNPIDSRVTLNRPIPGQGLTNDPDNPYPWEKAPEFTNLDAALGYLLNAITQEESYAALMDMIAKQTPLMELTQVILFKGFTEGKWNPDLMMIAAEPLCYMLLALAERADITAVILKDDDEDIEAENQTFGGNMAKEKLNKLAEAARKNIVPKGVLPKAIEEDIENLEVSSLLAQPAQAVEEDGNNSLLGRN
tara:strand:- start:1716 stop:2309 length:594 start_codon:yes stop_codon:yes gene_type:complete